MLFRKGKFDVCREIREAGLTTPILMLTDRGLPGDGINAMKIGVDEYLTEPFDMRELVARVKALVRPAR